MISFGVPIGMAWCRAEEDRNGNVDLRVPVVSDREKGGGGRERALAG